MIELRPPRLTYRHLKCVIGWLSDKEVMKYSEQRHVPHSIASQFNYVNSFREPHQYREIFYHGVFVGTVTGYIDRHNGVADVGLLVGDKTVWGKGVGYTAWEAFCDSLAVRKIEAGCMSKNIGMIRIMERYGMVLEGRRKDHFMVNGETCDLLQYGRFK